MELIEKYVLSRMTYIDDIKDNIKQICHVSILNMKYLKDTILSSSAYDFIEKINGLAVNTNKHFLYKQITLISKEDEVYTIAWNLKKDFPIFIIGKFEYKQRKYLDEYFCMEDENLPNEISLLLSDFQNLYEKSDSAVIK